MKGRPGCRKLSGLKIQTGGMGFAVINRKALFVLENRMALFVRSMGNGKAGNGSTGKCIVYT